ncbi:MAG: GNAT family N-acetyltransferase [Rhodothermaceae bacterium]|nr:GNAT family N-acetyltransferase [Rhodothermaceae bacterium]
MTPVQIRTATEADVPALAALYAAAARAAGPAVYTPEQVETWATFAETRAFRQWVVDAHTLVAEADDGRPIGFSGLAEDGHVTALYIHPDRMRQGVGSALLRAVLARAEAQGLERLYVETNPFSRPLFERFGFRLVEVETVTRGTVTFERTVLERLPPFTDPPAADTD